MANVASALKALPALAPLESMVSDSVGVFAGYLVLDAVIGNTDRHDRNWAVIRGRDGSVRLSPTFDHASSLGFAISDDERDGRLRSTDRQFVPAAFARRARTPFAGQPHPCQIAIEGLREAGQAAADYWIGAVRDLAARWAEVERLAVRLPEPVSESARRFAVALLEANVQEFLSEAGSTLTP